MNIDVVVDDVILILILTATNSHELVKASKRRENIWENKWFLAISQMARHNICSPDNLSEVCKV
jgi:hypothetical protein